MMPVNSAHVVAGCVRDSRNRGRGQQVCLDPVEQLQDVRARPSMGSAPPALVSRRAENTERFSRSFGPA